MEDVTAKAEPKRETSPSGKRKRKRRSAREEKLAKRLRQDDVDENEDLWEVFQTLGGDWTLTQKTTFDGNPMEFRKLHQIGRLEKLF